MADESISAYSSSQGIRVCGSWLACSCGQRRMRLAYCGPKPYDNEKTADTDPPLRIARPPRLCVRRQSPIVELGTVHHIFI